MCISPLEREPAHLHFVQSITNAWSRPHKPPAKVKVKMPHSPPLSLHLLLPATYCVVVFSPQAGTLPSDLPLNFLFRFSMGFMFAPNAFLVLKPFIRRIGRTASFVLIILTRLKGSDKGHIVASKTYMFRAGNEKEREGHSGWDTRMQKERGPKKKLLDVGHAESKRVH